MRRSLRLLILALLIAMISQQAMAEVFTILVIDANKNTVENAWVNVLQGDNLTDTGVTDSNGMFLTYLNLGMVYSIIATNDNREGEIIFRATSSVKKIIIVIS